MLAVGSGLAAAQTGNRSTSTCDWMLPELSDTLGVPITHGRALVAGNDVSVCWFSLPAGGRVSILLRRRVSPDWAAAESARMRTAAAYRPARIHADQAFLYGTRDGGATACVFSGRIYLQVSVSGAGSAADHSASAERLGNRIVTHQLWGRMDSARALSPAAVTR
jgi:hypothetical protein